MSARATLAALLLLAGAHARAAAADLPITVWLDDDSPIPGMLQEQSYAYDEASSLDGALADGPAILLISATAPRLKALLTAQPRLDAFFKSGGWLVLNGVDQSSLASFDALVGVDHILRPFRSERVAPLPGAFNLGSLPEDVSMRSAGNPWAGDVLVSDDAYVAVVDTDDVAPFLKLPDFAWFRHADDQIDHNPLNLVDGFGSRDSWKRVLALYPGRSRMDWTMSFPRPTAIKDVEVDTARCYPGLTEIAITLDGGREALLEMPHPGAYHLTVDPPRTITTIGMRVTKTDDYGRGVVGIDEIHVAAAHPAGWDSRVHPLASIGVLVEYPRGPGGILLCQLDFHQRGSEKDFLNFQRRERVLARLVGGLGARRGASGRPIAPSQDEARGTPLPLESAVALPANQDLLGAQAAIPWPKSDMTIGGVAIGIAQPRAVLARAGETVAVRCAVSAEALVLLQAAECPDAANGDELGHYHVVYADGHDAIIPIVLGRDVGELRAAVPALVERAQLSLRGAGATQCAFYLRQWGNPTPDAAMATIELCCTRAHAAIALLALTALH